MENYQPKISLIEMFLLIIWGVIIDIIGLILVLFALDDFFILDLFGIVTQFYFRMKGVNGAAYDLAGSVLEFIPYIGALPLKTAGIVTVIWVDRHPTGGVAKAVSVAQKVAPVKAKAAAGVGDFKTLEGIKA